MRLNNDLTRPVFVNAAELACVQGWGRLPKETNLTAEIGPAGATVWLKDAPLLHPDVIAMPG